MLPPSSSLTSRIHSLLLFSSSSPLFCRQQQANKEGKGERERERVFGGGGGLGNWHCSCILSFSSSSSFSFSLTWYNSCCYSSGRLNVASNGGNGNPKFHWSVGAISPSLSTEQLFVSSVFLPSLFSSTTTTLIGVCVFFCTATVRFLLFVLEKPSENVDYRDTVEAQYS